MVTKKTTEPAETKVDIFMPIYIGDYLKDTNRLSPAEHGAYLLLMFDYWQNGELPDNDIVLSRIARMSADEWDNSKCVIKAFFKIENGKLRHSRIERELKSAKEKRAHLSSRGKAGADARWNAKSKSTSNACGIKVAMPKKWQSPSPSESHSESPSKSHSEREQYSGAHADFVNEVINCRPEFSRLLPETIALTIHNAEGNPRLKTNHDEFVASASNMINAPNDPIGMYRKFLASTGGKAETKKGGHESCKIR